MNQSDIQTIAASLFDGGWRAADMEALISEYNIDPEKAEAVCSYLEQWEGK